MAQKQFFSGVATSCASAITSVQTSITGQTTATWSASGDYIVRMDGFAPGTSTAIFEDVLVTANNAGTGVLTVTRAQDSTSAQAFAAGATLTPVITLKMITDAFARIDTASNPTPLTVVPSLGGTAPATSYGSMPIKLAEITTTAGQVNPTLSSIPSGYRHLQVDFTARDSSGGTTFSNLALQFNGDTTALYDDQIIIITGTTVTGAEAASATSIRVGTITNGAATANMCSRGRIEIPDYTNTAFFKTLRCTCDENHTVGTGVNVTHLTKGQYRATAAITSITFVATFAASCVITLYGTP